MTSPFCRSGKLLALLLSMPGANAVGQSLDQAFFSLQTAMTTAAAKPIDAAGRPPQQALDKLQAQVNVLQSISGQLPAEDRSLYAKALMHDASVIRAASRESDQGRAAALISDIEADLKIKSSARAGMAMASRFNGKVSVSVNTKRANHTVGGYVIILNPVHYKGGAPFVRFDKVSSPTLGAVPPGRYEMIAQLDGTEVKREVVTIGLDAQSAVALDLQVP